MSNFYQFISAYKIGKTFILFLIACFIYSSVAWADLPTGAKVESGDVTFDYINANQLDIHSTSGAVLDWSIFKEGSSDSINFLGPQFLNNVSGITDIEGKINSPGLVIFSDPLGVNIGRTAQIQVGSLIATTLGIGSSDFMAGRYNFERGANMPVGMVINRGNIVAAPNGFILLLGGAVENSGTLTAQLGKVTLASGDKTTVAIADNKLLSVVIDEATKEQIIKDGKTVKDAIKNTGKITANGGTVELTAQTLSDVFDRAINQKGIITAQSVDEKNGKVVLEGGDQGDVIDSGRIDVSGKKTGQTGGDVEILGKRIALIGNASVDASGDAGAGNIHIGKDARNSVPEADQTVIQKNVRLDARAINSGNGGFIETSGKILDAESSHVFTTGGGSGANGDWLLDPYNLTISTAANTHPSAPAGSPFEPSGGTSNLNVTTLETALASGNVTIETGNDAGAGNGNITVANNTSISYNSAHSLTLNAYGNVELGSTADPINNPTIDAVGTGSVTIKAGYGVGGTTGTITFDSDGSVFSDGSLTLQSKGNITQNGNTNSDYLDVNGLTIDAGGGNVNLGGVNSASTFNVTNAGSVTLIDSNETAFAARPDLNITGITATGDVNITENSVYNPAGNIIVSGAINASGHAVTLTNTNNSINDNGGTGSIVAQTTNLTAGSSSADTGAYISLTNSGNKLWTLTATAYGADGGGNGVSVVDGNTSGLVLDNINSPNGNVSLTSAGDLTQKVSAAIITSGNLSVTANNIYLNNTGNYFTGNLSLSSNGNPMNVSIYNTGYTTQDLSSLVSVTGTLNSFLLDLPNYNPNASNDTTLSSFISNTVLPNVANSSSFDMSLILPNYTSAIQAGDDTSGASTHLFDFSFLPQADEIHNLTLKTAGNLALVLNNGASMILSVNQVDLESTKSGASVSVQTLQDNNVMEINDTTTLKTSDNTSSIVVSGHNFSSQVQTPTLNLTTNGGSVNLSNLQGVDSNSFALNMTELSNAMPNLTLGGGLSHFNAFNLTAHNFNGATNTLASFLNTKVLNNATNGANFDLSVSLAADTNAINIGNGAGASSINLGALSDKIDHLTLDSAGDINFRENEGNTFQANAMDLESTAGNVSVNAASSNDRVAVNNLTLKATQSGSTINVNNTGVGKVDTAILNLEGNNSTINLTNLSSSSSFALNMIEDSALTLSTLSSSNIGKLDSFSLTASNLNPGSSSTIPTFLNNQILNNVARASSFDLTLNLPAYTGSLSVGSGLSNPFVDLSSLSNGIHNLTVATAGSIDLSNLTTLTANQVNLTTTGAGANIIAASVHTPVLNTTTNGGTITLDQLTGNFALNMTEESNAMPNLVWGQNGDGYAPTISGFSLTAPNFNLNDGSLESFFNNSILNHAVNPSTFDLSLNLANDTNSIAVGDSVGGNFINLNILNDTLHNLSISSAGAINFKEAGGHTITANQVTLATTGNGSALTVNAQGGSDRITMNTLNTTSNGGTVTLDNGNATAQSYALNMTENSGALPNLTFGGTSPNLTGFGLIDANFNQAPGVLEPFINTVLMYATSPSTFNLSLNLANDINTIEIGDDTAGSYINLNTSPLNNTIGNVTIKSAGTIDLTNNGGGTLTANGIDLETTGFAAAVNIDPVNGGDAINTQQVTVKTTGQAASITTATGAGTITTPIVNIESNGSTMDLSGISSTYTLNLTEDSDNTPNLGLNFGSGQISSFNVTMPNFNLGNSMLSNWFNTVFQNNLPAVSSGFNLSVNASNDMHIISMGYEGGADFIDLSQVSDSSHNPVVSFGDLSIKSAGQIDLLASNSSLTANSADLETTGKLFNVDIQTGGGNTITLTSVSTPLTIVATGGGNINVSVGGANSVSASIVNTSTAGGSINLSLITGGSTGISSPYALNTTDNSPFAPSLTTSSQLNSFSFTAPNLIWNVSSSIPNLLNSVLSNEAAPSTFNLTLNTAALRDTLDLASLTSLNPTVDDLSISIFGNINLSSPTVDGNLILSSTNGDITQAQALSVVGISNLTAGNDITLTDAGNDFGNQAVNLNAQDATLVDADTTGFIFAASTLTGNLSLTAAANVTETGALNVTGATTVNTGAHNITLNNASNDFGNQAVSLTGHNVTLTDTDTLGLTLGASTVGGNLNVTSNADVTQSGALVVTGTSTINAGTRNITLTNTSNDFSNSIAISNTHNVSLKDMNDIDLGAITATGAVNVTAAGAITNNGNIATNIIAGADSSLTAGTYLGTLAKPLTVSITGALNTTASGQSGAYSGVLTGTATSFHVVGSHPAPILFNGIDEDPVVSENDGGNQIVAESMRDIVRSIEFYPQQWSVFTNGKNLSNGLSLQWNDAGASTMNDPEVDHAFASLFHS